MKEWLASRTPPAPRELLDHLLADVAATTGLPESEHTHGPASPVSVNGRPEALMTASEGALDRVLSAGASSRGTALDLLSSDAFVTYAFEAAADDPATVPARADAAMRRISRKAEPHL